MIRHTLALLLTTVVFAASLPAQGTAAGQAPAPEASAPAPTASPAPTALEPAKPAPAAHRPTDCLAVPDFPDYPGAVLGSFKVDGPEFGISRTVRKTTRVSALLPEVKAYFQKLLNDQGWLMVSYQEKPGEIDWSVTKGDGAVEIELDAKAFGAVEIDVKRRDR